MRRSASRQKTCLQAFSGKPAHMNVCTERRSTATHIGASGILRITAIFVGLDYFLVRVVFHRGYVNQYLFGDSYIRGIYYTLVAMSAMLLFVLMFDLWGQSHSEAPRPHRQTFGYWISLLILVSSGIFLFVAGDMSGVLSFCTYPGCFFRPPWT